MYPDRLPLQNLAHTPTQDLHQNDIKMKECGQNQNLKRHMWIRLRRILAYTTSYYRKKGMRLPKSPAEENRRLRSRLMKLRDQLQLSSDLGREVSESELERVLLTVAAAILNPIIVPLDANRLANRVKNFKDPDTDNDKIFKFFEEIRIGHVNEPATVLDCHGSILVWYLPDIFTQTRVEELNASAEMITEMLQESYDDSLKKLEKGQGLSWRNDPDSFFPPPNPRFHPGSVDFSAAWFAQGRERLNDRLITSTTLRSYGATMWMAAIEPTETIFNSITALTHHSLYKAGLTAVTKIVENDKLEKVETHKNAEEWPSVYTGIGVIVNRITTSHRDSGGCPEWYDLLASCGTHTKAELAIPELGATFSYSPGTVIEICGKVLSHNVAGWEGGERICMAHYMRNMVHERLGIDKPIWSRHNVFAREMNAEFRASQGWRWP